MKPPKQWKMSGPRLARCIGSIRATTVVRSQPKQPERLAQGLEDANAINDFTCNYDAKKINTDITTAMLYCVQFLTLGQVTSDTEMDDITVDELRELNTMGRVYNDNGEHWKPYMKGE
jgi:hypothetical protein